jgi:hypothetical protein
MVRQLRNRRGSRRRSFETLETRQLLAGFQPTAHEQLFLEDLNDARANPAAYGQSIGVDLSYIAPSQPLAFNQALIEAARLHSQDMNGRNYFDHDTPDGVTPEQRVAQAGYVGSFAGESIAGGTFYTDPALVLHDLIVDADVPSLGHRNHLLSNPPFSTSQSEFGIGAALGGSGKYTNYWTVDTGIPADTRPFLAGVVFDDANQDGKYAVGEGLAGVTISVAKVGSVTSFNSGGYEIQLNPGTYTVTASGGALAATQTKTVTIGASTVRLNFTTSSAGVTGVPANLTTVAETLTQSQESYAYFVTQAYQHFLGRTPDASGLDYWVGRMQGGLTDEHLEAGFLGTTEYINDHGGPGSGWVKGMYVDLLGRPADPQGLTYWVSQLQAGAQPSDVAYSFAASPERESQRIEADYQALLGRPADTTGLNYWLNAFLHGSTNEDLVGGFVGSSEYYQAANKGNANKATWVAAAYEDIFHRAATTDELTFWAGVLT